MDDLEVAKQRLREKKLSLVFVKNFQVIFETDIEGLRGFLQAIEELNDRLWGASVADKTIGRAAALLCAYVKAKTVFAVTMSNSGLEVLETSGIRYEYENVVPTILDRRKTDRCPFEKLVETTTNPEEAYEKIRRFCGL
jgi:hypothetical protein